MEENNPAFIADVHLGKLAKALRLLGFDVLYTNSVTPAILIATAAKENRILLSRSAAFAKYPNVKRLIVQSETPKEQLQQVVQHFGLKNQLRPFSRCLVCNGMLIIVPKEKIQHQLQQNTTWYYDEFWQCTHCQRPYWKGSHYLKMLRLIENMETAR